MNKKLFIYIVFFVFIITFVIAATSGASSSSSSSGGGGAGGSGGGGAGGDNPSGGSSSGGGEGPYLYGLKCFDTGQIVFKQNPPIKPVIVEKENDTNFTIFGEWKGTVFTSEEAEIIDAGTYILHDSKNGNKKVNCPELKFSCKLVNIDITECIYEENKVTAKFTLTGKGASAEELRFRFWALNSSQVLEYQKDTVVSSELKEVQFKDKGNNTYTLEFTNANPISLLEITHPKCIGKYYINLKTNCTKKEELSQQEKAIEKDDETTLKKVIKDKEIEKTEKKQENNNFLKVILFFKKWFSLN